MTESLGTITGTRAKFVLFTGTTSKTCAFECINGPPADIAYAVEPVGVDIIKPSATSCHKYSLFTYRLYSRVIALLAGNIATSFIAFGNFLPLMLTESLSISSIP